jgi:ribosomal protein S17E
MKKVDFEHYANEMTYKFTENANRCSEVLIKESNIIRKMLTCVLKAQINKLKVEILCCN